MCGDNSVYPGNIPRQSVAPLYHCVTDLLDGLCTLQLRDLRLLDPQLATSYPSAILARERALVVNLEYIKCIITQDCVLVLNPGAFPTGDCFCFLRAGGRARRARCISWTLLRQSF